MRQGEAMTEMIGTNLVPVVLALLTGGGLVKLLDLWATRRARDVSNDILLSAEARAIAGDLRAELAAERAERHRVEEELDAVKADLAAERGRCADLARRVAELERIVLAAGLHLPGETPPHGTPAAAPRIEGGET